MVVPVLRYQDKEGRGPFRPGLPALWADPIGQDQPSVFERFPDFIEMLPKIKNANVNCGCAVLGWDGLDRYFTRDEQERLHCLGYRVHRVPASAVILSDDLEAVFVITRELKTLPRARRKGCL